MKNKAGKLRLTTDERQALAAWARKPTSPQRMVCRAKIILLSEQRHTAAQIARLLGIRAQTVRKWCLRFQRQRIDGLADAPRPGAPRKLTDDSIGAVVTALLRSVPPRGSRWTSRLLAARCGLSQSSVVRLLRTARIDLTEQIAGTELAHVVRSADHSRRASRLTSDSTTPTYDSAEKSTTKRPQRA